MFSMQNELNVNDVFFLEVIHVYIFFYKSGTLRLRRESIMVRDN